MHDISSLDIRLVESYQAKSSQTSVAMIHIHEFFPTANQTFKIKLYFKTSPIKILYALLIFCLHLDTQVKIVQGIQELDVS